MSDEAKIVSMRPLSPETALSSGEDWKREVGRWRQLIESGALPKHIRTPEIAITLARAGQVYGWDPIRSLRSLFIVEGKVEMWAQDMLGLIRERCPEAIVQPVVVSPEKVTIRVARPPQMPEPFDVTVTRAQFAHLIKPNRNGPSAWQLYTEDLLWARCISRVGRRFFSDVTAGAYTAGETAEGNFTVRQVGPQEAAPLDELDQRPPVEMEDVSQDFDDYEEPPEDWKPGGEAG